MNFLRPHLRFLPNNSTRHSRATPKSLPILSSALGGLVILLGLLAGAEARSPAGPLAWQDLLKDIKRLERKLGFKRTRNFSRYSNESAAAYRCYYTGTLELPDSYEALQLKAGSPEGCSVDSSKFDVFFYPIEAIPYSKTPVTASLAHESVERFLVVVPHEDFHENKHLRKLPATLNEAASTLMGFLTAAEVAREKFGSDSEVYRNLVREPGIFQKKCEIVNRSYEQLAEVYAKARSGAISESLAFEEKGKLFGEIQQACRALAPNPKSFNKCLAANNNAGLAFDHTYTKYYPLIYQLYLARCRDLRATNDAIQKALNTHSEAEALARMQALTHESASNAAPPAPTASRSDPQNPPAP